MFIKPDGKPKLKLTPSKGYEDKIVKASELKPIAKVSAKMKVKLTEYAKQKKAFIKEHPKCQFEGCKNIAIDIHHKAGRVGEKLLDVTDFMAICRKHHSWIHGNSKEAIELGYSISRLKVK